MNIIKQYRLKNNLTQKKLSEKVKISIHMIQAIEQNIRRPSMLLTIKLFKVLKIPITKIEFFLNEYTTICELRNKNKIK
jgi:transcriptional regulator with XRE-family HTH domain